MAFLHVHTANAAARRLYEKLGFTAGDIVHDYYADASEEDSDDDQRAQSVQAGDALEMWCDLCGDVYSGTLAE